MIYESPDDSQIEPMGTISFSESRTARTCSLIALGLAVLWSAFAELHILNTRNVYPEMFQSMNIGNLPWITTVVMSLWYAAIIPVLLAVNLAKEWLVHNRTATLIVNGAFLALVILIEKTYAFGAQAVMSDLVERLADGQAF